MHYYKLSVFLLFIIALTFSGCKNGPEYKKNEDGSLTWLTIDDAANLKNEDGKLYFVDIYTDWCSWCKVMDKETFTNEEVIKELDERFHVVKFNAEQPYLINWEGTEYLYKAGGRRGIHELAVKLLKNRLSYPSFVVLDKNRNTLTVLTGYKRPDQFLSQIKAIKG